MILMYMGELVWVAILSHMISTWNAVFIDSEMTVEMTERMPNTTRRGEHICVADKVGCGPVLSLYW